MGVKLPRRLPQLKLQKPPQTPLRPKPKLLGTGTIHQGGLIFQNLKIEIKVCGSCNVTQKIK